MSEKITQDEWLKEVERILIQPQKDFFTETEKRRLEYRKQGLGNIEIAIKEDVTLGAIVKTWQEVKIKLARLKQKGR